MVNKGRNITADNCFTSIPLVTELLSMKTTYIGTLRKNNAEIPGEFLLAKIREVYLTLFGLKKPNGVCVLSMMSHDRGITKEEDKKP